MKNGLKTAVLLAGLAGLLMLFGQLFGGRGGLTIAFMMSAVMIGGSYFFSDKIAIRSARAVEVGPDQLPDYHRIMTELTTANNLPMPGLYVSPEQQPNAFATGRGPNHAAVCVTEGLLKTLSWEEISGVLAHELAHIRNRDVLIGSVAAMIATTISYTVRMAMWGSFGRSNNRNDGNPLIGLAFAFLAPVAAGLIQMAISRSREFEADRRAAIMLNDGEPLARALEKLHGYAQSIPSSVPPPQASHYIVNPLANRDVNLSNLFATHPDAAERIERLRSGEWRT